MKPNQSSPLANLLAKLIDCRLNEEEKTKLEEILRKNPAAREYYRFYMATHLEIAEAAPQMHFAPTVHKGFFRRFRVPFAIAALIPLAFALALWAPWRNASKTSTVETLAVTTVAKAVSWSLPQAPQSGLDLQPGRIHLTAGTLALEFRGKQVLTFSAPSDFELINDSEIFLHRGNASLRMVGPSAPFTILVPRGKVVDLGTEFSVKVAADGVTDVWVFEGKALVALTSDSAIRQQQSLTAGESLRIAQTLVLSPAQRAEFIRPLVPTAGDAPSSTAVIADFSAEFPASTLGPGQPFGGTESPAAGWNFLWNPNGILGTAANYQPLAPNTVNSFPAANGGGIFPMFTRVSNLPFNHPDQGAFRYGRIAKTSIHPGKFVLGKDYRAIIAYTIQSGEAGKIHIANSSLAKYRVSGTPTNGVDLDVYVNDRLLSSLSKNGFQSLAATDFNGSLGTLAAGDTVYVTLGCNGNDDIDGSDIYDAFDACIIDFQLVREH